MKQPNIIYILSDQHNSSVLGCAGDKYIRTPNIDRLAQKGTMLTNCYCSSPLCVPSRSSLLSGLMPTKTGITNNMQCLPSDKATFVHCLSVSGYETVLSGRMHFVGPDQRHGFEKRFVGDITNSFPGLYNDSDIYGPFETASGQNLFSINSAGPGDSSVLHYDLDVADAACNYLENRDDERPLFMTVGLYGPHCPYIAPKESYDYYYNTLPILDEVADDYREKVHPAIRDWYKNRNVEHVSIEQTRVVRAAYYGMVEHIDKIVGRVVEKVEKTIGFDNTLIIYGSDHGDNIGEHGLFWKTNFYDGASKVPMIFSFKDRINEKSSIDALTCLLDLAPTLINISDSPKLPEMQGKDITGALINGDETDPQRAIISILADIKGDNPSAMVVKGDYKLVKTYGYEQVQLFNLKDDPHEMNDLGCEEETTELRKEMLEILAEYWCPEEAYKNLIENKNHLKILQEWSKKSGLKPVEEWECDNKINFILKD